MARFKVENGIASYQINDSLTCTGLNVDKMLQNVDLVRRAVDFALKTMLRNATAGKMKDAASQAEAAADVQQRMDALNNGKWSERKETGEAGESSRSILALALAKVLGREASEAADLIADEIKQKLDEAGIDADAETDDLSPEDAKKRRKIATAVRKGISEDPAVAMAILDIKAARDAAARAELAKGGKTSRFA